MPHHDSTPESILAAPAPSVTVVHANRGPSRAQLRAHGVRTHSRRARKNTPFVGRVADQLTKGTRP